MRTYNGINDASHLEITCNKSHPNHLKREGSCREASNRLSQRFQGLGNGLDTRLKCDGASWKAWRIAFHPSWT